MLTFVSYVMNKLSPAPAKPMATYNCNTSLAWFFIDCWLGEL